MQTVAMDVFAREFHSIFEDVLDAAHDLAVSYNENATQNASCTEPEQGKCQINKEQRIMGFSPQSTHIGEDRTGGKRKPLMESETRYFSSMGCSTPKLKKRMKERNKLYLPVTNRDSITKKTYTGTKQAYGPIQNLQEGNSRSLQQSALAMSSRADRLAILTIPRDCSKPIHSGNTFAKSDKEMHKKRDQSRTGSQRHGEITTTKRPCPNQANLPPRYDANNIPSQSPMLYRGHLATPRCRRLSTVYPVQNIGLDEDRENREFKKLQLVKETEGDDIHQGIRRKLPTVRQRTEPTKRFLGNTCGKTETQKTSRLKQEGGDIRHRETNLQYRCEKIDGKNVLDKSDNKATDSIESPVRTVKFQKETTGVRLPGYVVKLLHRNDNHLVEIPHEPTNKNRGTGLNAFNLANPKVNEVRQAIKLRHAMRGVSRSQSLRDFLIASNRSSATFDKHEVKSEQTKSKGEGPKPRGVKFTKKFCIEFESMPYASAEFAEDHKWAKVGYRRALECIRFTVPSDCKQLELKNPLYYLRRFTVLDKTARYLYKKAFDRFKEKGDTVLHSNLYKAIQFLLKNSLLYSDFQLVERYILNGAQREKYDLEEFLGVCAFCERRFWSMFGPRETRCCSLLEKVDFETFYLRLPANINISENMHILLRSLNAVSR